MKSFIFATAAALTAMLAGAPAQAQHTGGSSGAAQSKPVQPGDFGAGSAYRLGGSSIMSVGVTREHKSAIQERLVALAGPRAVSRSRLADVRIAPGYTVPRERVRIRRLPADVVEIAPEYTNYEYFVLDDGAVVIVDPRTYEIMDLIAA